MRPGLHDENIEIPLTFDVSNEVHVLPRRKIILGVFIFVGIVILSLVVFFLHISWLNAIIAVLVFIVGTTALRLVWFDERYYRKCYAKLLECGSRYEQDLVWDIYDIVDIPVGNDTIAVCRFRNGVNGIFVSFDKDITIGKGLENEYSHYEAISDAYQFIAQKGFTFMHIDYMDVVGKDERFDPVINELLQTPNEDLRQLLAATFEYQKFKMNRAYASYDVYCFYYSGDDILFLSELDSIISKFMEANYIRYKILDMDGIRELVKSIYNLPEFSIYKACDKVLSKSTAKRFIKVRKVEKDGVVTVISKTSREAAEEAYLKEKKKGKNKRNSKNDTMQSNVNIGDEQAQGYGEQSVRAKPENLGKPISDDMFKPISDSAFVPVQQAQSEKPMGNSVQQGSTSAGEQTVYNPFVGVTADSQTGGAINNNQGGVINSPINPFETGNSTSQYNPFAVGAVQSQSGVDMSNKFENSITPQTMDSNSSMSQKNFVYENSINGIDNNDVDTQNLSDNDESIDW